MTNQVRFRSISSAIIKEISITRYSSQDIRIYLEPSSLSVNKLSSICQRYFNAQECTYAASGAIILDSKPSDLLTMTSKIRAIFEYLNREYGKQEISSELLNEITQLLHYVHKNPALLDANEIKHLLTEDTISPSHVNPSRATSLALIEFLDKSKFLDNSKESRQPYNKAFNALLASGEDPNQCNSLGESAITKAITDCNIKYLEMLLIYGAHPLQRPRGNVGFFYHALELAAMFYHDDKINLMISALTKLERPINQNFKVKQTDLSVIGNQIATRFQFSNDQSISTLLKKPAKLTANESNQLYKIFSENFELENQDKNRLKEIFFRENLAGENKFVELIYARNKMVGFNLFEIIQPKSSKGHIFLHCAYALIDPEFRGYGLMSLLAFRLAFSLQLLAPKLKVGIFFCAVHYNSYQMIKDLLHYPKYQSTYMQKLMNDILQFLYEGNATTYHETITCYVKEKDPLKVKGLYNTKSPSLIEKFFYQDILDYDEKFSGAPRVAPIGFYVEDHSYRKFQQLAAKIGVDFEEHIQRLAILFSSTAKKYTRHHRDTTFNMPKNNYLFWNNESIPSNLRLNEHATKLRAKL